MTEPESTGEKQEIRDEKGRFKPGISGNPEGKPQGAKNKFSFTDYWQKRWEENPGEFTALATEWLQDEKLRALIIQMIDGRPKQDITSDGKALPTPIYGGLSGHDSNKEDLPAQEKD